MNKNKIQLLGIAYDAKSSFMRGAAQAPIKIKEILHDGSSNFISENGIDLLEKADWTDAGDIEVGDYPELLPKIKSKIDPKAKPIFLGGDHSITFPLVEAMADLHGPFSILHFDAHTDLYDIFEGDRFSHACPFARIMEKGLAKKLIQVGIRNVSKHHQEQAEKFDVDIITMRELDKMYDIKLEGPVYLSLDIDVFDPAFVPGVSHHEPGGMNPREFINAFHKLELDLIGADIVEYNPFRDVSDITAALAAKMLKEIAGKMLQ
ncbi:MAG: agmatinase [Bacteroidota bacterium]